MDQGKKFPCLDWKERYSTKYNLEVHHRASHLAERVNCGICGQTFSTASGRQRHVRHKHFSQLRFECSEGLQGPCTRYRCVGMPQKTASQPPFSDATSQVVRF